MRLILRALFDPSLKDGLLARGELFARIRGRHHFIGIRCQDAVDNMAFSRLARHKRFALECLLTHIESQFGLAMLWIIAVTVETVVGKDGADVAIEFNSLRQLRRLGGQEWRHCKAGDEK